MNSIPTYFNYWGKAEKDESGYHLLVYHCLDVAAVGNDLLEKNVVLCNKFAELTRLDQKTLHYLLCLFLALHDIGKFSVTFQGLREDLLEKLQGKQTTRQYTIRHDSLGQLLWKDALWRTGIHDEMQTAIDYWEEILDALSKAFTGHHGVPPRMSGLNNMRLTLTEFFEEHDQEAAISFIHDLHILFSEQHMPVWEAVNAPELYERSKLVSWFLAGFIVLCDWIGSNASWFKLQKEPIPLDEYWVKYAVPQAKEAVRNAGIGNLCDVGNNISFRSLFPKIKIPTPMQHFISECSINNSPQIFILEDITGSGKTEAALYLAQRIMDKNLGSGIFFALPTMATSNAMFERMIKAYRSLFSENAGPSIVLAHSARHLSEEFMNIIGKQAHDRSEYEQDKETASAQCTEWLADNRKKALLADVGVGTLDQALLAVLPSRFQSLRLFGIAGHIIIVDEVHAYDPYMNMLLQTLLKFHASLGGSVILLSATLPQHTRQAMLNSFAEGLGMTTTPINSDAYPLVTQMSGENGVKEYAVEAPQERRRSVEVRLISKHEEIEGFIVKASQQGKCVCWIRNTVHDAVTGHEKLKKILPKDKLMIFHARFAMGDRLDIEKRVDDVFGKKSRAGDRNGKVLVATQVVEQSLDLDFDVLISDLAPMDLLIQRAGRLHRHFRDDQGNLLNEGKGPDRREPPLYIIHSPDPIKDADGEWFKQAFPKAAYVYPSHGCLWLTALLLRNRKTLRMPDDARELIEAAFSEKADELIPAPLRERDFKAEGEMMSNKSAAHINMLKIEEGYAATPNQWLNDMHTPTRLGEMATTVRLARWDGMCLTPWYTDSDFPWDMSQVSIRSTQVQSETDSSNPILKDAIETLKLSLPDKGKWSVLVPLVVCDDGLWKGEALSKDGHHMIVAYNPEQGVAVTRKE